ncbi:MAG: hypothetical protein Q9201_004290 [Fulgogasparrea decipioides]
MPSFLPTTDFTLLYSCGHTRVFRVEEITPKAQYAHGCDAGEMGTTGSSEQVSSPTLSKEIDLGTAEIEKERVSVDDEGVKLEATEVRWRAEDISSLSSCSSSSSRSSSLSLSSTDPMYFHPSKMRMRVFDREEGCPACSTADKEEVDGKAVDEAWDCVYLEEDEADTGVLLGPSEADMENVTGWWDMFGEEYWGPESDWQCTSDLDVDGEIMEALEMI